VAAQGIKAEGAMATRDQLALELLMAGCISYYDDYLKVSRNLRSGFSLETILEMPELARWPEAREWLKERL
jgi:hypothetical protein